MFGRKSTGPKDGTWRIRENAGTFYVECWERYYYPGSLFAPLHWQSGRWGWAYPTYKTQAEAEAWIDERLHPEKYNHVIATFEPAD